MILAVESVNKEFWENLSDDEITVFMFMYGVFILNNIVNPYVIMDTKFRIEANVSLKRVLKLKF